MSKDPKLGEIVFSQQEILSRVTQLAAEIEDAHLPGGVNLMPVYNGACHFFSDLCRRIRCPVNVYPAFSKLYDKTKPGKDGIRVLVPDARNLPKKILVVEDILDTGTTLESLGDILHECGVEEVKICVLLHKRRVNQDNIFCHYVGFTCPRKFVVGYGMDFSGSYRNLPDLHVLKD